MKNFYYIIKKITSYNDKIFSLDFNGLNQTIKILDGYDFTGITALKIYNNRFIISTYYNE